MSDDLERKYTLADRVEARGGRIDDDRFSNISVDSQKYKFGTEISFSSW